MSQYIGVRAFNRSQGVRIGGQAIRSTVKSTGALAPITYIDLEDKAARKQLAYHSAIGAVYTCTEVQSHNYPLSVVTGATIDQGSSASDLVLGIASGEVRADDGTYYAIGAAASAVTIADAHATLNRIDLVTMKVSDRTIDKVTGAPASSPVAPAVPSGYIPLASVLVDAAASGIANAKITDIRPRPQF